MLSVNPSILRILIIIALAVLGWISASLLAHRFILSVSLGNPTGARLRTLTDLVKGVVSVIIITLALIMILREIGFDVAPLLASAGVFGLAVGFGAQTLVKDVISGFFLLMEDQFREGDEVEILGKKGIVDKITLRTVWVIDKEGGVHIIPNGQINMISNYSKKKT